MWLQRALNAHETDAESLSLLGEMYMHLGEGDDIALKFCEKSLELEPDNPDFRLRYSRVLSLCGRYEKALDMLSQCFRFHSIRAEAWFEAAANSYRRGDDKAGVRYANKVIEGSNIAAELKSQAKNLLDNNGI